MQGSSFRWTVLVSLNVLTWGVLVFSGKIGAVPPNQPPFANAVEQNMEIIRELKEIKTLLQDQNTILRTNAVRKVENAARPPKMVQDNPRRIFRSTTLRDGPRHRRTGVTLVEMMIVVLLLGIVATMVIPNLAATNYDQLVAAAHIVASEFNYARSLAVANGSSYTVTFDTANNRLLMTYSGTNTTLTTLPSTPFRSPSDPSDQQIMDFDLLPSLNNTVAIAGGYLTSTGYPSCSSVQFGALGNTVGTTNSTVLYLYSGSGGTRLYISISVDPITGLVTVGTPTNSIPVSFGG